MHGQLQHKPQTHRCSYTQRGTFLQAPYESCSSSNQDALRRLLVSETACLRFLQTRAIHVWSLRAQTHAVRQSLFVLLWLPGQYQFEGRTQRDGCLVDLLQLQLLS